VRAATRLRLLRLSGDDLVSAVTGYAPSRSAADALVAGRLRDLPAVRELVA
jgi:hypothetical protein